MDDTSHRLMSFIYEDPTNYSHSTHLQITISIKLQCIDISYILPTYNRVLLYQSKLVGIVWFTRG